MDRRSHSILLAFLIIVIPSLLMACRVEQDSNNASTLPKIKPTTLPEATPQPEATPAPKPQTFDLSAKCKTYIGGIMGRSPDSMRTDHEIEPGRLVGISYVREDDSKKFMYECRSDGNTIVWRGVDIFAAGEGPGRWRDEDAKPISSI